MSHSIRFRIFNKEVVIVQVSYRIRVYVTDIPAKKRFSDLTFRFNPAQSGGETRLAKMSFSNGHELYVIENCVDGVIYYRMNIYHNKRYIYSVDFCTSEQVDEILLIEQD